MDSTIVMYGPSATKNARQNLGDSVTYANSLEQAIASSDILIAATSWKEFTEIDPKGKTVIDACQLFRNKSIVGGLR